MRAHTNDLYGLLKSKDILAILDGDKIFGELDGVNISMPYLNGPDLCGISNKFGLPTEYSRNGGALSRWEYLNHLIDYCISQNKMQQLLSYLFSKSQFAEKLKGMSSQEIEDAYTVITDKIIQQISGLLYFGGHEFAVVNKKFVVMPIGTTVEIEAPAIKGVDTKYIKGLSERALQDIKDVNFDSAITKCRTLLEEVFCYVIELKDEVPSDSGDIGKLYNQVKALYNMHQDKTNDKRINMLLSGLEKILTSISQMRNNNSDSHGVGSKRIAILEHHARLYHNASVMMADFILEVSVRNNGGKKDMGS